MAANISERVGAPARQHQRMAAWRRVVTIIEIISSVTISSEISRGGNDGRRVAYQTALLAARGMTTGIMARQQNNNISTSA